ncbi:MAG TPA: NAD(P)-dependent oxidoreductase [Bacteroidales bacterium]|nr:NAD(P)-dependent oxidoreductase [Bacteroidales bacterium]HOH22095.1 NAD(P)-dependent oxidoreductase [Bacteroidales bacterium]HPB57057.1 NAD(P)-dependent oxidoreductase [Bacteroidales bacterium]HPZ03444.1 NAD(P)-dependent oxidoreductase [Bacteroidales bacterium]HQB74777.1 NAD(P)-dependent oxidoreductase [Bacteroidales bacterium]
MSFKILVVDIADSLLVTQLEAIGFSCEVNLKMTQQEFQEIKTPVVGLIIRSRFPIDAQTIDSHPELRFIVRLGAGVENIDVAHATFKGVEVISTPQGNAPAVGQFCLAMLLNRLRNISESDREVRRGEWLREKNKGKELSSLTIGIVGFGNTGQAFYNFLKPFNPEILVYDRYKTGFKQEFIQEVSLDVLLKRSDVVSIHINYIEENHYFFNAQLFSKMKRSPILINTSRGAVLNTQDLLNALDQGLIDHACLDVLEFENHRLTIPSPKDWPPILKTIANHTQVTLTPHIAGQTFESEKRHAEIAVEKIRALLEQKKF